MKRSILVCLGLLAMVAMAATATNVDNASKWSWSTVAGWINWEEGTGSPTWGASFDEQVSPPHELNGYLWCEGIGWIHLSPAGSGVTYTVSGDIATFSGYAWSTVAGWINFNPVGSGGVTGDQSVSPPVLQGDAWGEGIGWISMEGTNYGIETDGTPFPVRQWMLYEE